MTEPEQPTVAGAIEKFCAACGKPFGCGVGQPDCWCTQLPPLPAEAIVREQDCLCPTCLEREITRQPPA